ncbi:MAG: hypothetical protein IT359_04595 [Gemmatimonadaceae bacterium]|nr:hypothetical protein [Gemmatimonadaceae bacterium]
MPPLRQFLDTVMVASLAVASVAGLAPRAAQGQSVRPSVVEYPVQGRGRFELVNETLFPLTVVLEPRGFSVDEQGNLTDLPLDTTNVELRLSAMSFRIPPLGTYTVSYEARARQLPAWFMVLAAMTGARTSTGLNVRLELPHVVYLLQKDPLARSAVAVRSFDFDSAGRKAVLELENTSDALGRVLASELSVDGKHGAPFGGFPLFPRSRRRVEVPWDGSGQPDRVVLRFARFTLDEHRPVIAADERRAGAQR